MIFTDGIHIASDLSVIELHQFAETAGIGKHWFHWDAKHSHYDKPKRFCLTKLLEAGAIKVTSKELVKKCFERTRGG